MNLRFVTGFGNGVVQDVIPPVGVRQAQATGSLPSLAYPVDTIVPVPIASNDWGTYPPADAPPLVMAPDSTWYYRAAGGDKVPVIFVTDPSGWQYWRVPGGRKQFVDLSTGALRYYYGSGSPPFRGALPVPVQITTPANLPISAADPARTQTAIAMTPAPMQTGTEPISFIGGQRIWNMPSVANPIAPVSIVPSLAYKTNARYDAIGNPYFEAADNTYFVKTDGRGIYFLSQGARVAIVKDVFGWRWMDGPNQANYLIGFNGTAPFDRSGESAQKAVDEHGNLLAANPAAAAATNLPVSIERVIAGSPALTSVPLVPMPASISAMLPAPAVPVMMLDSNYPRFAPAPQPISVPDAGASGTFVKPITSPGAALVPVLPPVTQYYAPDALTVTRSPSTGAVAPTALQGAPDQISPVVRTIAQQAAGAALGRLVAAALIALFFAKD